MWPDVPISVFWMLSFKPGFSLSRRRQWQPTPVLLPGKSHGRRSLVGFSPWGCKESDMTEQLHFYFSLSCTGEGNGNPLQCSCLENPRDGRAWWAAIYGIAQSRTQLKWLSSFTFLFHLFQETLWFLFTVCHKGGVICISDVFIFLLKISMSTCTSSSQNFTCCTLHIS